MLLIVKSHSQKRNPKLSSLVPLSFPTHLPIPSQFHNQTISEAHMFAFFFHHPIPIPIFPSRSQRHPPCRWPPRRPALRPPPPGSSRFSSQRRLCSTACEATGCSWRRLHRLVGDLCLKWGEHIATSGGIGGEKPLWKIWVNWDDDNRNPIYGKMLKMFQTTRWCPSSLAFSWFISTISLGLIRG